MKEIEITMEKTRRLAKSFTIPDSVYDEIRRTSRIPDDLYDEMSAVLDSTYDDLEYDYAVWSETEQRQLVEWG